MADCDYDPLTCLTGYWPEPPTQEHSGFPTFEEVAERGRHRLETLAYPAEALLERYGEIIARNAGAHMALPWLLGAQRAYEAVGSVGEDYRPILLAGIGERASLERLVASRAREAAEWFLQWHSAMVGVATPGPATRQNRFKHTSRRVPKQGSVESVGSVVLARDLGMSLGDFKSWLGLYDTAHNIRVIPSSLLRVPSPDHLYYPYILVHEFAHARQVVGWHERHPQEPFSFAGDGVTRVHPGDLERHWADINLETRLKPWAFLPSPSAMIGGIDPGFTVFATRVLGFSKRQLSARHRKPKLDRIPALALWDETRNPGFLRLAYASKSSDEVVPVLSEFALAAPHRLYALDEVYGTDVVGNLNRFWGFGIVRQPDSARILEAERWLRQHQDMTAQQLWEGWK